MQCICTFDKNRDLGIVIPGLFPDIEDLITNGKITDTVADVVCNGLEEIGDVGFRINDDFEAIMLSRALQAQISQNTGTGSSQQAGSSAPVAAGSSPAQLGAAGGSSGQPSASE